MSIRKVVPISEADWRFEPPPAWVEPRELDWEFEIPGEFGVAFLLVDEQHHVASQAMSSRLVRRVMTRSAVQALGQVEIDFDPAAHRLRIHDLVVWRKDEDGFWQGRSVAQPGHFLVRQREQQLEQQMLNGRASVVALVEDLRIGDAIDLSWTLESRDVLPGLRFTTVHGFVWNAPTGATQFTLHLSTADPIRHHLHCPEGVEPPAEDSSPGRLSWKVSRPQVAVLEPNAPPGRWNFAVLEVSGWRNWREVADFTAALWAEALAAEPESLDATAAQLRRPEGAAASASEAIRFVQGEVRYLNVDFGHGGGLLPNAAGTVLRRRFGDCKDKTVLLVALLRQLGIEAWPLLVNTSWKESLALMQPSLGLFNHVIVAFEVEGARHFVDPTFTGQRGDLAHLVPPPYGVGLEVRAGVVALTEMPSVPHAELCLTETFSLDRKGRQGSVEQELRATSWLADDLRGWIGRDGPAAFFKMRAEALQRHFPALEPNENGGEVTEDPVSDAIEVRARHGLPTWGPKSEKPPGVFRYGAHGLFLAVESLEPPEVRTLPWKLRHPMRVRHRIIVQGRGIRRFNPERHRHSGPGFAFACDVTWSHRRVTFDYCWETTADRVEAPEWPAYVAERGKALDHGGASVVIHSFGRGLVNHSWVIAVIVAGALGVLARVSQRESTDVPVQQQVTIALHEANKGDYAAAAPVLERYSEDYRSNAAFQFVRSETAIHLAEFEDAAEALELARSVDPENPFVDILTALLLRAQGDVIGARNRLIVAVRRQPEHARTQREMALLLTDLGESAQAREAWGRVLALQPGESTALRSYAVLLWEAGGRERADAMIAGMLAAQPAPVARIEAMAGEYFAATDRLSEGIERMEEAVRLAPLDAAIGLKASSMNLRAGRTDRAFELAKQLVERLPGEPAAWQAQAVAAAMAGRTVEAEAAFQQWLRLAPEDPLAYANWGHFLSTIGKAEKAAEVLAIAANRFPGEGLIWLNLSDAQTALGDHEAASAARARAERLIPPEQRQSLVR